VNRGIDHGFDIRVLEFRGHRETLAEDIQLQVAADESDEHDLSKNLHLETLQKEYKQASRRSAKSHCNLYEIEKVLDKWEKIYKISNVRYFFAMMIRTNIKNPELVRKKHEQICSGAMEVFKKKGFHCASMREIARSSGIGLGNLYDYIEKKEDILFLIHTKILSQIYQKFDEVLSHYQAPENQLSNAVKQIFSLASELREEVLFIYTETRSLEKRYLKEVLERESEFIAKIETLIQRGVDEGVFDVKSPSLVANIIGFNLSILPLRGWSMLKKNTEEEILNDLKEFILRGVGAKARSEGAVRKR